MSATEFVTTAAGLRLAVTDVGPRDAQAIVFIHGIAQRRTCFDGLFARLRGLRLLSWDLRGHGESDDPADEAGLNRATMGEDLATVIEARQLVRPVVAGWSYGGVVIGEFLRRTQRPALGGIVSLAGSILTGREAAAYFGPVMMENGRALVSTDEATYLEGARRFVSGTPATPPPATALESAVAGMRRVTATVRRAFLSGGADYRPEYAAATVPVAAIHGTRDAVVLPAMSALLASIQPRTVVHAIEGAGHTPWDEAPAAFDRALDEVLVGLR
jgi:non-heme chloroperoxidase